MSRACSHVFSKPINSMKKSYLSTCGYSSLQGRYDFYPKSSPIARLEIADERVEQLLTTVLGKVLFHSGAVVPHAHGALIPWYHGTLK